MKKFIAILSVFAIMLSVSACGGKAKYQFKNVGIYDTSTRQYVEIGDSKKEVEKILGSGEVDGSFYDYDDDITISYDENENVNYISVYYDSFDFYNRENEYRYELPGGIGKTSSVTDFIELFPHVYVDDEFSLDSKNAVVIIRELRGKHYVMSREELVKLEEKDDFEGTFYKMEIDYFSYDEIVWIKVERIKYPDLQNWEKSLVDINK